MSDMWTQLSNKNPHVFQNQVSWFRHRYPTILTSTLPAHTSISTRVKKWKTMKTSSAAVTSHLFIWQCLIELQPIIGPSDIKVYLGLMEKDHFMSVTFICQLTGVLLCWHHETWKIQSSPWLIRRDRWLRHELQSNAIMYYRYEYKMTKLTGHTRFLFHFTMYPATIFVVFVLFSSDYLHSSVTAG